MGEYWLYDPTGGLHKPRLRGFRLMAAGTFARLVGRRGPRKALTLVSPCLGLGLRFDGERLRLWDPAEGAYILSILELDAAWREALEQLEAETEARQASEWRAQTEARARGEAEQRAQTEARARQAVESRAQVAEERIQIEALARQAAEDRVAELEAKLKASKDSR